MGRLSAEQTTRLAEFKLFSHGNCYGYPVPVNSGRHIPNFKFELQVDGKEATPMLMINILLRVIAQTLFNVLLCMYHLRE